MKPSPEGWTKVGDRSSLNWPKYLVGQNELKELEVLKAYPR